MSLIKYGLRATTGNVRSPGSERIPPPGRQRIEIRSIDPGAVNLIGLTPT